MTRRAESATRSEAHPARDQNGTQRRGLLEVAGHRRIRHGGGVAALIIAVACAGLPGPTKADERSSMRIQAAIGDDSILALEHTCDPATFLPYPGDGACAGIEPIAGTISGGSTRVMWQKLRVGRLAPEAGRRNDVREEKAHDPSGRDGSVHASTLHPTPIRTSTEGLILVCSSRWPRPRAGASRAALPFGGCTEPVGGLHITRTQSLWTLPEGAALPGRS